jgi:glutathione S-transferase
LGITYRRIPLLAIGKDIYADTSLITDVIVSQLGKIPTSPADKAYEAWGKDVFSDCLGLIPSEMLTDEFIKDRQDIFPTLARPDIKTLRPSALANVRGRLETVERQFLAGSEGPFIGGSQLSLADIHISWAIKMALGLGIGNEPGFGKNDFPKVYKLIENLPSFDPPILSDEETHKIIREASYTSRGAKGVDGKDPTGFKVGTPVSIESFE